MASMEILISGVGPLPLSNTFKSPGDGVMFFYLSGSAWSQKAGSISIQLLLDGNVIGKSVGFTNETSSHKTLVPVFIPVKMSYDTHTIELQVTGSTTLTDLNDNFQVVLFY